MPARWRATSAATSPASPNIVVKNMPGAGSAKAAQFIANIAPKDGTVHRRHHAGRDHGPAARRPKPSRCSIRPRCNYVGTANSGTRVCVTLKGSQDRKLRRHAQGARPSSAAAAPNDSTYEYGYLHKRTSGAIYDIVAGYRGTPEMALAMERGEIDGMCGWDWSSFKSQKPDWLRDNKANVLLQVSLEPHPELTKMGVPTVFKFVKNEEDRKVVELVISQTVFHRSYIAPPETPPAQLAVLRAAFDTTMADKQFLDDAEKMRDRHRAAVRRSKVQELVREALRVAEGHRRARQEGDPLGRDGTRLPHRNLHVAELKLGAGRHRPAGAVDQRDLDLGRTGGNAKLLERAASHRTGNAAPRRNSTR